MKLLRIISSVNPSMGGPVQGIRNITAELARSGVETEVLSLDEPGHNFAEHDAFKVHSIGKARSSWGYQQNLLPWLHDNLSNYDVVICHGIWQYQGYALRKMMGRLERQKRPVPKMYIMPHGMLDPYFQQSSDRRLKAVRNWVYWKLIESRNVSKADGLLFTCEEELKLAGTSFVPYKPKNQLNIGYGITAPPAYKPEHEIEFNNLCKDLDHQPYFLYISRLHEKKGVDMLITAYTELKKTIGQLPKLIIAGPGLQTEFGQHLQKLAGNSPDILFPGMLTGDAKWGAFYGCQAFILPSHQENFGISVVEAMACNKPVLISNKINIWREIQEDGGGLIEDDTVEGTSNLLTRWVGLNPAEMKKASNNARKVYEKYFTVKKISKGLVEQLVS